MILYKAIYWKREEKHPSCPIKSVVGIGAIIQSTYTFEEIAEDLAVLIC